MEGIVDVSLQPSAPEEEPVPAYANIDNNYEPGYNGINQNGNIQSEIGLWLISNNLEQYINKFEDDNVTINDLKLLSEYDMENIANNEYNMKTFDKNRFINGVKQLQATTNNNNNNNDYSDNINVAENYGDWIPDRSVKLVVKKDDVWQGPIPVDAPPTSQEILKTAQNLEACACFVTVFCNFICGIFACSFIRSAKEETKNDPENAKQILEKSKGCIGISVFFGVITWIGLAYYIWNKNTKKCTGLYC